MLKHHPLVTGAHQSVKNHHPLMAMLMLVALVIFGELLGLPPKLLLSPLLSLMPDTSGFVAFKESTTRLILPFGGILAAVCLYVTYVEKRTLQSLGLPTRPLQFPLKRYWGGFGLGLVAMASFVLIATLLGIYDPLGFEFELGLSPVVAVVILLPGWMIQGASEEVLTRGWLFQASLRKHLYLGVFLSTVFFGLLHLANDGLSALSLLNLCLYGLFALALSIYSENLWAACGFHAAWNWAQGNLFGILVSGSTTRTGSLMHLGATKGPHWLTGGPFGAEGSVIVSALLLLMIGICLWGIKKKAPSWSEKSSYALYPHSES